MIINCPSCGGSCGQMVKDTKLCDNCSGSGTCGGGFGMKPCNNCNTSGRVEYEYFVPCSTCNGIGKIDE